MTLRFKIGSRAPQESCKIAYVKGNPISVRENVRLTDLSYTKVENVSIYSDSQILVDWSGGETIDTNDIVVSSESIIDKNINTATPLFYKHSIGNDLFQVVSNSADTVNLDIARQQIKESIKFLDINNTELKNNSWDIRVTLHVADNRFEVDLYVDRRASLGQVFKIKYNAFELSSGIFFPNHIEVLDPQPYLAEGTDYTLTYNFPTNDYSIAFSPTVSSPAINLFSENPSGSVSVTVNSTNIVIGASVIPHNNRKSHEISHDINKEDVGVLAVPAANGSVTDLITGVFTVQSQGLQLLANENVQIRYNEESRIRAKLPVDVTSAHPWNLRINSGRFSVVEDSLLYSVPEFHLQPWSPTYAEPYKEVIGERVEYYTFNNRTYRDVFRVKNRPLHPTADITIKFNGIEQNNIITDIDRTNGIVFLSQNMPVEGDVQVSYIYKEKDLVYRDLELNPTDDRNPDILNKFIGVYIIPSIRNEETFSKTVYHMIKDTEQELLDDIAALEYSDTSNVPAFLIGIYQITEASRFDEIEVIDIRQGGGGIVANPNDDIGDRQPEWDHYADIGKNDGHAFQGASVIIVQAPSEIIGDSRAEEMALIPSSVSDGTQYLSPSGLFSKQDVEDSLYRYMPAGHLLIIDYKDELNGHI